MLCSLKPWYYQRTHREFGKGKSTGVQASLISTPLAKSHFVKYVNISVLHIWIAGQQINLSPLEQTASPWFGAWPCDLLLNYLWNVRGCDASTGLKRVLLGLVCLLCSSVYYENVPAGSCWSKKMRDVWSRLDPSHSLKQDFSSQVPSRPAYCQPADL